jgi:hypothetical protein
MPSLEFGHSVKAKVGYDDGAMGFFREERYVKII